jgi:hypothetical protein
MRALWYIKSSEGGSLEPRSLTSPPLADLQISQLAYAFDIALHNDVF